MRTLITSIAFSLISLVSFAGPFSGDLQIIVPSNGNIHVEVDNRSYNDNDNSILIRDLSPGYHTVKIYRAKGNSRKKNARRADLIYSSSVYVKARRQVNLFVNRNGDTRISEEPVNGRNRRYDDDDRDWDRNDRDWDRNDRNRDDDWRRNDDDRNYNGRAVSRYEFESKLNDLRRERFEALRVAQTVQFINNNYFTTSQVRQLMNLFNDESRKLDIAKRAYDRTTDPGNYHQLYTVFSYEKNRRDLEDYCRNRR